MRSTILFCFLIPLYFHSHYKVIGYQYQNVNSITPVQSDIKKEALNVLAAKCNTCHERKRKTEVFTSQNMDDLAREIHTQVFVKQKMPKGKKNNLTDLELQSLAQWLSLVLEKE